MVTLQTLNCYVFQSRQKQGLEKTIIKGVNIVISFTEEAGRNDEEKEVET